MANLDDIDLKIVRALQMDGCMLIQELALKIGP
jgi:hypothetical protein